MSSASAKHSHLKYRPDIDGLRALAVIPVILFHAGFQAFGGGFVGVDVFFVISGYLITTIILSELEQGNFSILNFYERRARRILPALFFVILCSLPFAWQWLLPQDIKRFSQGLVAVSLFASNILFWRTSGYFDTATELNPLLHTWSLSVEEQYYVFFPLFLLFAWRKGKRWIGISIVIVALVSLLFAQYFSAASPMFAFYLLPTRAWELMIGALVAFYYTDHNIKRHKPIHSQMGSLLGFILICFSIFFYDKHTPFPSLYTLAPTLGAALIITFNTRQTLVGFLLSRKLFVSIGLISYSAYLWHQPLFAFARRYSESLPSLWFMACLSIISLVLASATWHWIERPFRNRHQFNRNAIFQLSAIASFAFVSLGFLGHITNGALNAKTNIVQRNLLVSAKGSPKRAECHTGGNSYRRPSDACEYFDGKLRIATFGDSHTVELAYALADELRLVRTKIKHFSFSGCPPMFARVDSGAIPFCTEWTNSAVDTIISNKDIDTVVVSYRIHMHLFGEHEASFPVLPDDFSNHVEEREKRWSSYVSVLHKFIYSGKKVILVLQAPELPKPIDWLIIKSDIPISSVAGVSRSWWDQRSSYVYRRLNEFSKDLTIIDPTSIFCDATVCYAAKDGTSFYFDDDHLSVEGARLVAKQIVGLESPRTQ